MPTDVESHCLDLEPAPRVPARRVSVVLPVSLETSYDYLVPADITVEPGAFVMVPFGNQQRIGVIWDRPDETAGIAGEARPPIDPARLKNLIARLDVPPLPAVSMRFAEWIARYTLAPRGTVVRMMMSAPQAFEDLKPRFGVKLAGAEPGRMTPGRTRVMEIARDGVARARGALANEAGVGMSVVDGLVKAGTLVQVELPRARLPRPDPDHAVPAFEGEQIAAVTAMRAAVDAANFNVTLLDGVTGSGKTEVYFEAVARAIAQGRQVLVLLPEIALTGQFIARFEARFGTRPVEWHSAVSPAERARIWRAAASGEARAVIGARSALFLPFRELGLIVVDEEHDTGYKQIDRVTYQGRDMAVVRGLLGNAGVVLASATPSLESLVNARNGRYRSVRLSERYSDAELPDVVALDLRRDPPERGRWLSPVLADEMAKTLGAGQQSLLFLNRRGYAPLTLCRSCGFRINCPQCSTWLVEHRTRGRLSCHHCGFTTPVPEHCPKCGDTDALVACGPGVERIAEEVRERFPEARLGVLSSDSVKGVTELRALLRAISDGEIDIIIGTQIVAKGHHFPGLATVGIVDGDLGLGLGGDPRAAERTFQLLHQVTGRAGRTAIRGRGLLQTHQPDHPVMQAIISGDREAFVEREIMQRQAAGYPPFGRLVAIVVSSKQKPLAEEFARIIALKAPPARTIEVFGPAEAPLSVIRGRHRYRLLVKAPREADVQAYMRAWLATLPKVRGDLRFAVDIDPYSFL